MPLSLMVTNLVILSSGSFGEPRSLSTQPVRLSSRGHRSQLHLPWNTKKQWAGLHRVEVDAAEAQKLAGEAILFIVHAWLYRSNESFLKARPRAEELATLEDKYAPDASTWKDFRAALVEYLEPEPRAAALMF